MIVQKDFLNKLKDFGLNSYETKLWTALLSRGVSTAGELSDIANVPRSRSYDVLESLEKKGFILMKIGKPIKYIAVQPSEVVERVKKSVQEDAETKIDSIDSIRKSEVLSELNVLFNQGVEMVNPIDLSGNLKGRNNIYNHLSSMIGNAEKSVAIITSQNGLLRKAEVLEEPLRKAKKKGVKIRIAAPISKETDDAVKSLKRYADIRFTNENSRFCVVDGKEIMFMLTDDNKTHPNYDSGVWVNTKLFASTLDRFFDMMWNTLK